MKTESSARILTRTTEDWSRTKMQLARHLLFERDQQELLRSQMGLSINAI